MKPMVWIAATVLSIIYGCVAPQAYSPPTEDSVTVQLSYRVTFERLVDHLKAQGYTIAIADQNLGIIETAPQRVAGEQGSVHHKAMLSFLLQGGRSATTVYLRVIVTSDAPEEREKLFEVLKGLSP